ncbi:hypothetical protein CUMW_110270 [Citrus unshiu]|nr:hypothetical protein CUMW_110270 [Citrus unshiu]
MLKLRKCHHNCMDVHPVKTQMISSGLLWGLCDVDAPSITHFAAQNHLENQDGNQELMIEWKRVARTSFGFRFVGPVGHFCSSQVMEDVKSDFLPAFVLEGGLWPLVQAANFQYEPVLCLLSWIEQQEDASWKQWIIYFLPSMEQKGHGGS